MDVHGPEWMVLVSLIASFLLIAGLIIYKYIYPKKNISLFILLLLLALLPLVSIFRPGIYESGDIKTHIMETILFYDLLKQGELFPIWAGEMNATYGYPAFHFTYPLPFYVMSFFHFLGFSYINSAKLLLAASFFFSGLFMYLWLKKEVKEYAAVAGALFYLFAPYHLINMHFRVDVGEMLAFVFLPLCLLAAKNFMQTQNPKWFVLESVSFTLLLLSHPATSLAGFIVLPLYIFILILTQSRLKIKQTFLHIVSILLAMLLSAFYWLPVLHDLQYTSTHAFIKTVTFLQPLELLFSPWMYGFLFQGPEGRLSFSIGYIHIFMALLAILLIVKNKITKKQKPILLFSLLVVFITTFMMMEISKPLWETIPFLKSFQFSYRLLGITMLATSIVAALVINNLKNKKLITFLCFIVVFSTLLNWGNRGMLPRVTDNDLRRLIPYTATNDAGLGQAAPIWTDYNKPWAEKIPEKHIEIISGNGSIEEIRRNNTNHLYAIDARTELLIKENTLYFPGWNIYINDKPQKVTILDTSTPKGLISFKVPKGKHRVAVVFEDTPIIKTGKAISGVGLLLIVSVLVFKLRNKILPKSYRHNAKH